MNMTVKYYYSYNEIINNDRKGSWWEHIILGPFVHGSTWLFANYIRFSPNQITFTSFIFGILSAYSFLQGTGRYLIIGALLYEISFILDCTDGRIARLKNLCSRFGAYLDFMSDTTKYFFIIFCLIYGQYLLTNDSSLFLYGFIFIFLDLTSMTQKIYHKL